MKKLTPMKAIRAYCLECSGDSFRNVKLCVMSDCPLYPYRMGRRPKIEAKPPTLQGAIDLKKSF